MLFNFIPRAIFVEWIFCIVMCIHLTRLITAGSQAERGSASTRPFGRVYVACSEPLLAHLRMAIKGISLIAMAFPANS